ncbi:alkylated DNA repair protein alkB homolog 8 isoform X3 [Periplaneta americana]|uniref:alkylated DNA repair protein alkB homolog 8 isoform X3 n=1 Tax=Periplaneta americana TaxID=6978 RepID=UPI0037E8184A
MAGDKCVRKADKKRIRAQNILFRDTGIKCTDEPRKYVMVANAGLATGLQQEQLLELSLPYGQIDGVLMLPGKSYSFIVFKDETCASKAYAAIHGKMKLNSTDSGPLYLAFTEKGQSLKHRKVKHYGYEFRYDTNNVDKDNPLSEGIPSECNFLLERLSARNCNILSSFPNQLTVNHYQPGQVFAGIPPHVDTHSAFEDPILSLSLGSPIVMEFRHKDGRTLPVLLPQRSLLVMSEEARYAWSHGITPRKMDIVPTPNGSLTIQHRGERVSFTFRCIRKGECNCIYHERCDSYQRNCSNIQIKNDALAERLESLHVHEVYEEIASHFSDTRHKPWPNVLSFVESLPLGSMLVDVGCGNGKYFGFTRGIFEIGCDRSLGLVKVCQDRGFEVFNCNCLSLPLRSNIADGCMSIAVIHHLATEERRVRAVKEMVRILRPGGRALIYVWAKDQERHKTQSSYLRQDRKNRRECDEQKHPVIQDNTNTNVISKDFPSLPVHTNRTQFQYQDLLVPWKLKPEQKSEVESRTKESSCEEVPTFYRYYHVFEEGELEQLCQSVEGACVSRSYYDQGNWCVILEKQ